MRKCIFYVFPDILVFKLVAIVVIRGNVEQVKIWETKFDAIYVLNLTHKLRSNRDECIGM